jgi:hypothetical protein
VRFPLLQSRFCKAWITVQIVRIKYAVDVFKAVVTGRSMDQRTNLKFILGSIVFVLLNSLVIGIASDLAVGIWGRPRGVAFGTSLHIYWMGLSIYGLAMVAIFRAMPVRNSLLVSVAVITTFTVWTFTYSGWRTYLSVYLVALSMCLFLGAWEYRRRIRC